MRKYRVIFILAWTCSVAISYPQITEISRWENDIRHFEHLDSTESYSDHAILFAGSSSIRLWSALAADMAPYDVIQRGYGGAKLSDFVVYAERIIYPHPCRAIVLFIANDIVGDSTDISPQKVTSLTEELFQIIRRKMEDVPVFYIATTPTPLRWEAWPQIKEANDGIRQLCSKSDHTFFIETDFAYLSADGLPRQELFQNDSLHLNEEGYRIWTQIIRQELRQIIGEAGESISSVDAEHR